MKLLFYPLHQASGVNLNDGRITTFNLNRLMVLKTEPLENFTLIKSCYLSCKILPGTAFLLEGMQFPEHGSFVTIFLLWTGTSNIL